MEDEYSHYSDKAIECHWAEVELQELTYYDENHYDSFEMYYRGFKITRTWQGDYEIYRIGRKQNYWLLDHDSDKYEKKYKEPKYRWLFFNKPNVIEEIKEEIDSLY